MIVRTIACGVTMALDGIEPLAMGTRLLGHVNTKAENLRGLQWESVNEFRTHAPSITP